jgi:hypothetical protein
MSSARRRWYSRFAAADGPVFRSNSSSSWASCRRIACRSPAGTACEGDVAIPGRVELAEIAGSDTFVHVHTALGELVAQLSGVHDCPLGDPITLYLQPATLFVFDADGPLVHAPARPGRVG